ncbi:MAG: 5-oxoprolinase subunit PxpA [Chloroflexi bacterium]|nr:5-oxoprolinase subunit PxpA [Chloroflexota bacterium]
MAERININSDMGESYGRWKLGDDAEMMKYVPTINLACGFHAGDPNVMRRTVELAADAKVEVGAHVALPDIPGFGRRRLLLSPDDLRNAVLYQVGALQAFVKSAGLRLSHVKPHGALYSMCGQDDHLAAGLFAAVREIDPDLPVIQGGEAAAKASLDAGAWATPEGYVDLNYYPNGYPVIEISKEHWDPQEVARRAVRLVREKKATAIDGTELTIPVPTICLHGDGPNSVDIARAVRERLAFEEIEVVPLAAIRG